MLKVTAAAALALALALGGACASPACGRNLAAEGMATGTSNFWYPDMNHGFHSHSYAPDLDNDYKYEVYRAVAPGDGDGIQLAINDNNSKKRHGMWLASQPRVCSRAAA